MWALVQNLISKSIWTKKHDLRTMKHFHHAQATSTTPGVNWNTAESSLNYINFHAFSN
jgi:hypothetical protein